jgi:hypothetical protein
LAQGLFEQFIAICRRWTNNKWIGTTDSGVFMGIANGQKQNIILQQTILRYQVSYDIDNSITGEVFIATAKV